MTKTIDFTLPTKISDDVQFLLLDHDQLNNTITINCQCQNLEYLTSIGIMMWVKYFRSLRQAGVKVRFVKVPPILMRTGLEIPEVLETPEIVSIGLPYFCDSVDKEHIEYVTVEALKANNFKTDVITIDDLSYEFDDIPSYYFRPFKRP